MKKDYDRIEWDFLWEVLTAFGFPPTWVIWIKECVTNVSYSIKVNGDTSPWFWSSRGLQQGDPLSPYLFIVCKEVLIRKLKLQTHIWGSGIGFKIHPRTANTPCLMFADDNLLFCKTSNTTFKNLKTTPDEFYKPIRATCKLSQVIHHFSQSMFNRQGKPF